MSFWWGNHGNKSASSLEYWVRSLHPINFSKGTLIATCVSFWFLSVKDRTLCTFSMKVCQPYSHYQWPWNWLPENDHIDYAKFSLSQFALMIGQVWWKNMHGKPFYCSSQKHLIQQTWKSSKISINVINDTAHILWLTQI